MSLLCHYCHNCINTASLWCHHCQIASLLHHYCVIILLPKTKQKCDTILQFAKFDTILQFAKFKIHNCVNIVSSLRPTELHLSDTACVMAFQLLGWSEIHEGQGNPTPHRAIQLSDAYIGPPLPYLRSTDLGSSRLLGLLQRTPSRPAGGAAVPQD